MWRMTASRRKAEERAKTLLEERGERMRDEDALELLRLWRFKKNKTRTNVMSEKQTWVYSDTLGVVRSRTGVFCLTQATRRHPHFFRALCVWQRATQPASLKAAFTFT